MSASNFKFKMPKLYCLCNDPYNAMMIRCNNRKCPTEYFHHSCVSISIRTKGIWYCLSCRANAQNYFIGKVDVEPIIADPNFNYEWRNIFCICRKFKNDTMIGCDNTQCYYQWFHYKCIQLETDPEGKWYCHKCRRYPNEHSIPRPGIISYIY